MTEYDNDDGPAYEEETPAEVAKAAVKTPTSLVMKVEGWEADRLVEAMADRLINGMDKRVQAAILRECKFEQGDKYMVDANVLKDMVRNFEMPVPIDMEFASQRMLESHPSTGAPTVGWVHSIELRAGGPSLKASVWGYAEWLDDYPHRTLPWLAAAVQLDARNPITGIHIGAKLVSLACVARQPIDGRDKMPDTEFDRLSHTLMAGIAKRRAEVEREFMLAVLGKDGEP